MKTLKNKYKLVSMLSMISCLTLLISCSDWDEFTKYTKNGEIVYPGKFDTIAVFPGRERVRLWGEITRDPKVTKYKISWDNAQSSLEFDIDPEASDFIVDQTFDVTEGTKTFTVNTYDAEGNSSVAVIATSISYGDRYRNTLTNRRIKSIVYEAAEITINWDIIDPKLGPESMEVVYQDADGEKSVITPATESKTILPNPASDDFVYRTIFRPLPTDKRKVLIPIDTFRTSFTAPVFVEKELDKAQFREKPYPGDAPANGGSGGVDAMWDGKENKYENSNFTDIGAGGSTPQMVTFDLGFNVDVTHIKIVPFQEWWGAYYEFSTIRDYEIYGSSNPNSNGALDESWTLLASGTFAKPSGGAIGSESAEDKSLAVAGFPVDLDEDAPKVRYIRIRCLKNYEGFFNNNSKAFFSIGEIRVFGMLPK